MKIDRSGKGLSSRAPKYPSKRTVNLAQHESHSRRTLTLSLGLALIVLLSFCVANFGVLRQLDRQRDAEQAYSAVHSQYTQMQQALAGYDDVELQYRTYSRTWMQAEESPLYVPVDRLEVLDLLQTYLMPYGTVNRVLVQEDVAIVTMSGMDLEHPDPHQRLHRPAPVPDQLRAGRHAAKHRAAGPPAADEAGAGDAAGRP